MNHYQHHTCKRRRKIQIEYGMEAKGRERMWKKIIKLLTILISSHVSLTIHIFLMNNIRLAREGRNGKKPSCMMYSFII
jgi:hypothetical protein